MNRKYSYQYNKHGVSKYASEKFKEAAFQKLKSQGILKNNSDFIEFYEYDYCMFGHSSYGVISDFEKYKN